MTRLDEIKQTLKMSIELNQLGPCNKSYQADVKYLIDLVEKQNNYLAGKSIWKARAESAEKLVERYESAYCTQCGKDYISYALNKEGE